MRRAKQTLMALWSERIDNWKASKKKVSQWCSENQVSQRMFYYWRKRLSEKTRALSKYSKPAPKLSAVHQFIEIEEIPLPQPVDSGVLITHQEIRIHLSKDFDQNALLKCLQTLKAL